MRYIFCAVVTVFAFVSAHAQDSLRVSVRANVKKESIQLRWAVNSPLAWKQTNRTGFTVERYTVVRNKQVLALAEKTVLTPQPLRPQPLDNWQALATTNSYAAVIAQALYGQDFQLSGDDARGVSKVMALAQELEQRYLVSLYAADRCYPAALLAGWGLEDKTAKPGERYLYRIIPVPGSKTAPVGMGSVYVSRDDYQPLPEPQELVALFGDKSVLLTWNYKLLGSVYNSYYLEKSTDGKTFTRLSETPLANLNGKDARPNDRMYYSDTLTSNSVPVHYRVVGVTAFSEEGPPSAPVSGQGKNKLVYVPHISRAVPNEAGGVDLTWEFDERGNAHLKGFELQRADNAKGPFVPVLTDLAANARSTVYPTLGASNYFVIAAIPREGEPTVSFPVLVQPADTLPPAAPEGLVGAVDSLGVVRLSWNPNGEKDLLGYRVYRGQTETEELIPITDVAVRENRFTDTLDVHNLNGKVYYAITAVDHRYNQSGKSPVAGLQKPDLVPPSPPVITLYKLTEGGVWLEWETGGEDNIAELRLYRQEKNTAENVLLRTFSDKNARQYTDGTAGADRLYAYSLRAVTAGGLASDPSPVVTVQGRGKAAGAGKITAFAGKVNKKDRSITLSWKNEVPEAKTLELYKGEAGKGVTLWKVIKAFEERVQDHEVKAGVQYEYVIRAVLGSGKTGATAKANVRN